MANTAAQPGVHAMRHSGPRPSTAWEERGACRNFQNDEFYPERSKPSTAKTVCAGCPVRTECLEAALQREEPFGVWGGLDTRERRRLLKARRLAEGTGVVPPACRPGSKVALCMGRADLIKQRLGQGRTHAAIAQEVGVSKWVMTTAIRRINPQVGQPTPSVAGVAA